MAETQVATTVRQAQERLWAMRREGRRVGLVPTMGALHAGHYSLVRAARQACDGVAVSVFVNPTQFGPDEDLERYPRTWDEDLAGLSELGVNLVFAPDIHQMYPAGATTMVQPPRVATDLEGRCRPQHFGGVATVVLKLFQVLPANVAFFGQKDYQQCLVVRDMVRDLLVPIELVFCPTVREDDGLALSSRNRYLSPTQRVQSLALHRGLQLARQLFREGERNPDRLEEAVTGLLQDAGIHQIDYVAARKADTLEQVVRADESTRLLLAAHVGTTRLIDNGALGGDESDNLACSSTS